jgi:hypothetical protein
LIGFAGLAGAVGEHMGRVVDRALVAGDGEGLGILDVTPSFGSTG